MKSNREAQAQLDAYVRQTAGTSNGAAAEIKNAKELLDSGAITDDDFQRITESALAGVS